MTKKKLILYGTILAVFCVFWVAYSMLTTRAVDTSSRQSLRDTVNSISLQTEKNLEYQAKDLAFSLSEYGTVGSIEEMLPLLQSLEKSSGAEYSIADETGRIYDSAGEAVTAGISSTEMRSASIEGYTFTTLVDNAKGWEGAALVVPNTSLPGTFIVEVFPTGLFADVVADHFSFTPEALAVFNEWGTELYMSANADDTAQQLKNGALLYAREDEGSEIQSTSSRQDYNMYINLAQPEGWFIGVRIQASQAVPMYASITQTSVLALVSWALLIALIIFLDITNDKQKAKELIRVSKIDPLTGLINASGMEEEITEFLKKHKPTEYSLVVMDVIAFSRFNTMFGTVVGDQLLGVIGNVLQKLYHCGTRMGGDVFGFLAKQDDKNLVQNVEKAIYENIEREIGRQYLQVVSFKFGVYPIMDEKHTFRQIYDAATLALKDAKASPEQNEVVWGEDMQQNMDLQRNIEINMLHALSADEFKTFIQPKFRFIDEDCCGGEALVRWQSEQMGFMPPDKFIPLFEKNGFIVELDFYMLGNVLDLLQREVDAGRRPQPISVNQSRVTITFPNYLERLRSTVEGYTVPLELVELEITETTLENNPDTVIELIQQMKGLGFSVAMDDFGTGFSSLNTLRQLPVDVLKIDKEFLRESDTSGRSRKIISNIVNMSRELGITVVCEGVETRTQVDFLRGAGCDIAQGYYFGKPMPMEEYDEQFIGK